MKTAALTAERARELLAYDPESGLLRWRQDRGGRPTTGRVAGSINEEGYVCLSIDRVHYRAHRVIWLIVTGLWPAAQIDHRDEDKSNNRWDNLRDVRQTINRLNRRRPYACKQGLPVGVHRRSSGRYMALLQIDGREKSYGTYDTAEQAHGAYIAAKRAAFPGVL